MKIGVKNAVRKTIVYKVKFPLAGASAKPLLNEESEALKCTFLQFAGAELLRIEWNSSEELSMQLLADPGVYLCISLQGKAALAGKQSKWKEELIPHQFMLMSRGEEALSITANGLRQSICIIRFSRESFLKLSEDANESMTLFRKHIRQKRPAIFSGAPQFLSLTMYHVLNEMAGCSYPGGLKEMFLKAKAGELLVLLAAAHEKSLLPQQTVIKNEYDRERILFARDYLLQHMDHPPSLPQLAVISGINEFKLKRGFKEIFNHTIFGYLSDARLELAKKGLQQKRKSVSEIAFELGYSSLQHFSKAFRKKYGIAPTALE